MVARSNIALRTRLDQCCVHARAQARTALSLCRLHFHAWVFSRMRFAVGFGTAWPQHGCFYNSFARFTFSGSPHCIVGFHLCTHCHLTLRSPHAARIPHAVVHHAVYVGRAALRGFPPPHLRGGQDAIHTTPVALTRYLINRTHAAHHTPFGYLDSSFCRTAVPHLRTRALLRHARLPAVAC